VATKKKTVAALRRIYLDLKCLAVLAL